MGKWSDLLVELLEVIEDNVVLYADKVRIRGVCLSWHLQLPKINREFPWLLQPVDDNVEASHALFNPIDKKYYYLDVSNVLQGKICKGSSHGWVVTIEDTLCNTNNKEDSNKIYLINPITSARIELPSRDKFPDVAEYNPHQVNDEYAIRSSEDEEGDFSRYSCQEVNDIITYKFVISSDPSRSKRGDCVVAALHGRVSSVAYCTLKDKKWYNLPLKTTNGIVDGNFADINFCKGKLHLLLRSGQSFQVVVFENIQPNPHSTLIARYIVVPSNSITSRSNLDSSYTVDEKYLVESSDRSSIFIVERYIRCTQTDIEDVEMLRTLYFKVRKINPANGSTVEVKGIGEDVVILGTNTPISISSRNLIGYKANHIYFTDSSYLHNRLYNKADACEIGVFSLEDGTLQQLPGLESGPEYIWPLPIWIDVR